MAQTANNLGFAQQNKELFDVIIVGAGVSGSTAAYTLKKQCSSLKILVIEAKNRVGGRTQTVELNCSKPGKKIKVDAGGQWVSDTQETITPLLKELNIETFPQFDTGTKIFECDEKIVKYNGSVPSMSISSLMEVMYKMSKINKCSRKVPTLNPFKNIQFAQNMDSLNLDQFLRGQTLSSVLNTVACRGIIESALRVVFGLETNQLNSLFALMTINSGGSIERLTLTEKGCAQEKRVKGGTQQISEKLISSSGRSGFTLVLNTAVTEFVHDSGKSQVRLLTENTETKERIVYRGKYVISSMPINQYANVNFVPELPHFKRNVFKSVQMGNLSKFVVTYRRAFWRENGYSGEVVSDGSIISLKPPKSKETEKIHKQFPSIGPINVVYDATTYDGEPALVGFIGGRPAVEWLDQSSEDRKEEILSSLVRYFGKEARDHIDFFEKNWSDEKFSGGCPVSCVSSAGVMKDYVRATREPFHNVHFCGTESAVKWQGYIDGAAESGIRAANEVLFNLSRKDSQVTFDYQKTYYFQCEEVQKQKQKEYDQLTLFDILFCSMNAIVFVLIIFFYIYVILMIALDKKIPFF